MIQLLDGPLADRFVDASKFCGDELRILIRNYRGRSVSFKLADELKPPPVFREAVYRLTDQENRRAAFVGWADEIHEPPSPMVEAMMNASDDKIIELIENISRKRPKQS